MFTVHNNTTHLTAAIIIAFALIAGAVILAQVPLWGVGVAEARGDPADAIDGSDTGTGCGNGTGDMAMGGDIDQGGGEGLDRSFSSCLSQEEWDACDASSRLHGEGGCSTAICRPDPIITHELADQQSQPQRRGGESCSADNQCVSGNCNHGVGQCEPIPQVEKRQPQPPAPPRSESSSSDDREDEPRVESPSCSLSASPSSVTRGSPSALSWSCANATSCSGSNFSTGGNMSGTTAVFPSQQTTYRVDASGPGGSTSCNTSVGVSCAASYTCSGNTIVQIDSQCRTSTVTSCAPPSFCTAGINTCQFPPPSIEITASPWLVRQGETADITWTTENVASCTVTENDATIEDSWTSTGDGQTTRTSSGIETTTIYTISCDALDGSTPTDSVTVRVVPAWQEF